MEKLEAAAKASGLPFWACDFNFYGPKKLIKAQWDCVRDALGAIPGARFKLGEIRRLPLPPEELAKTRDLGPLGIPTLKTFDLGPMFSYEGEDVVGHVFFSPVIPRTGEAAIEAMEVFAAITRKYKLPSPPLQVPSSIFERAFLFAVGLPVTRSPTVNAKIRAIVSELVAISAERGWGEYRTARPSTISSWASIRTTTTRCAISWKRSRTRSIRTASCLPGAMRLGRAIPNKPTSEHRADSARARPPRHRP